MELWDQITAIFADFADPKKRVFVGYLFLSVVIAFLWLILIRRQSFGRALGRVFDRKVFFSPSARADYKIFVLNRLFSFLISPLLLSQIAIATAVYYFLHGVDFLQAGMFAETPKSVVVALFSLAMFVVDDFTKYLLHRWMHRIPLLWAMHKTHHSATELTPITVYRVHPLEGFLYASRGAIAQGLTIPTFLFLFGGANVDLYTVVGVNVLVFLFHITGSNLRHTHISISYWPWLERILISPAQHQLHHSIAEEHYDKNFGGALAIWDWMFGSLHLSEKDRELEFGLLEEERSSATNLVQIYAQPFFDIARLLRKYGRRGARLMRLQRGDERPGRAAR